MKRSTRIARLLSLREKAEASAAVVEEQTALEAARRRREHEQLDMAQRRATENRSSASINELCQQSVITEATKNAIAAARVAETTTAAEADAARQVREAHTTRRRSLEKAHLRIVQIEAEERARRQIRDIQELSLTRDDRSNTQ